MQGVAVAVCRCSTARVPLSSMAIGAVDDLVPAVAVDVGDGQLVVALPGVAGCRPMLESNVQRWVSVPLRKSQAAMTVRV